MFDIFELRHRLYFNYLIHKSFPKDILFHAITIDLFTQTRLESFDESSGV